MPDTTPVSPVGDYNHHEPLPPLPDTEGDQQSITPQTKFLLDLYANEIREHASGIVHIYGLSPGAVDLYKRHCFTASKDLFEAADILRDNFGGTKAPIKILVAAPPAASPPPSVVTQAVSPPPVQSAPTRTLGRVALEDFLIPFLVACGAVGVMAPWVYLLCHWLRGY